MSGTAGLPVRAEGHPLESLPNRPLSFDELGRIEAAGGYESVFPLMVAFGECAPDGLDEAAVAFAVLGDGWTAYIELLPSGWYVTDRVPF